MAPTRIGGGDNNMLKQGKLNFVNKAGGGRAGEGTPPRLGSGEEEPNLKGKGTGNHRGKKQRQNGTPVRTSMEEDEKDSETMDMEAEEADAEATDGSPIHAATLNDKFQSVETASEFKILQGLKITTAGVFPALEDGTNPRLGPAKDLHMGKNFVKHRVISHGGRYSDQVNKDTKLIIIGESPGKSKVEKALTHKIHLVMYESILELLAGEISLKALFELPTPKIPEYLQGFGPPSILRKPAETTIGRAATPVPNLSEEQGLVKAESTSSIRFSNTKQTKRKQPTRTPERSKVNLVPASEVTAERGTLNLANLKKGKEPKYISVINVTLRVPSGNVTELVMDLLFMGLDTLRAEDKTVCFVHPTDKSQTAKKRQDMPTKFQKIHEDWAEFEAGISRFKNDIKEERRQTYALSIWLGSKKPTEKILDACTLEWEEERPNGGTVKMKFKQVQSLYTAKNLILVGVPTDVDADSLQNRLSERMEEARQKMVTRNRFKYVSLTKVPKFVLERDYVRNTPYLKCIWQENCEIRGQDYLYSNQALTVRG
jgi:hypothetical protein